MLPEHVLPAAQLLPVADDVLGAEPLIRCQRDKTKVHMGRSLVHMHHCGDHGLLRLMFAEKVQRFLKESPDFFYAFVFEELVGCGEDGFHHADAVGTGAATRFLDLLLRFRPVSSLGGDQVKVQVRTAGINVRVAGIFLFGAFVVAFDPADFRAFVFGKTHNGVGLLFHINLLKIKSDTDLKVHVPSVPSVPGYGWYAWYTRFGVGGDFYGLRL